MTKIFIPREIRKGERRVAATPESIKRFIKEGFEVTIEAGAGATSSIRDEAYTAAGASFVDPSTGWSQSDVVLKVQAPTPEEASRLREGAVLLALLAPHRELETVKVLRDRKVSAFGMELLPRTTRAQVMDVLSSQASIAGYKAVLIAGARLDRYFPLLMTAAGTIKPARVVIMGAGVAGLQALATAKRLGAVVEVSDIRAVVKEQVESLGGRFIPLPEMESGEGTGGYAKEMGEDFLRKQREIVAEHIAAADVVITTALIPGKKAPLLVTEEMVRSMAEGSLIIDLAVEAGGNCAFSKPDEEVVVDGVTIVGYTNLPSMMARDASTLYARNLQALLLDVWKDKQIVLDLEDEIVTAALLTHQGEVRHAPTAQLLSGGNAS